MKGNGNTENIPWMTLHNNTRTNMTEKKKISNQKNEEKTAAKQQANSRADIPDYNSSCLIPLQSPRPRKVARRGQNKD